MSLSEIQRCIQGEFYCETPVISEYCRGGNSAPICELLTELLYERLASELGKVRTRAYLYDRNKSTEFKSNWNLYSFTSSVYPTYQVVRRVSGKITSKHIHSWVASTRLDKAPPKIIQPTHTSASPLAVKCP